MKVESDSPHLYQLATEKDDSAWWAAWCQWTPTGWEVYTVQAGKLPLFRHRTVSRRKARRLTEEHAKIIGGGSNGNSDSNTRSSL